MYKDIPVTFDELEEYLKNAPKPKKRRREFDPANFQDVFPDCDLNYITEKVTAIDNILLNGIDRIVVSYGVSTERGGFSVAHFRHLFEETPLWVVFELVHLVKSRLDTIEPKE